MKLSRALRYLAPNLITAAGLTFGLMSLLATTRGDYVDAAWLITYAVMTDRLDGMVARMLRGSSELGVQLDSFADFLSFGVAPAFLLFQALSDERLEATLPYHDGAGRVLLMVFAALWVYGATFRLARFNISAEEETPSKIFFGVPTTLAAGLLIIWFLVLLKYSAPGDLMYPGFAFGGAKIFDAVFHTPDAVWLYFPGLLVVGGMAMASTLRMPKLGLARSKAATAFIVVNVLLCYACGYSRIFPDYMMWPPTLWIIIFVVWGQLSREAKKMRPPPLFPVVDPPAGREPVRPEDDLLPEGDELTLDQNDVA